MSNRTRPPGLTRAALLGTLLGLELRSALGIIEELVSLPNVPVHVAADLDQLHHALADWIAKTNEMNEEFEGQR
jgi:hypothetical protein